MRERPDGAELLAIAREVLRNELLPLLPRDKAYGALMIANAMGIAERQLRSGMGAQEEERRALAMLLERDGDLATLNRVFAVRIRQGAFDDNAHARELLWNATVQRVRESAPKALPGASSR
ncbi:DUF6285 domain-containing protein [Corallococcus macrosporus]|uniref:DUF6285 domain-containing protein n=1 Tax=Corallococcus macrosporus DSM 14697 TaxID=1189310 RepID=A0A250JLK5_9BACT|nr:DUF6285 domain-containing protein [Corallococcus macrosporus]ATB44528.1 hypothetical protein MYMAC_000099 [Corallococcus macrosporus DSM 14697]